jgi:putative transcriptional regulator
MVSLTGRLLVASPMLSDPNFAGTVVFVIHHDEPGAVGVVLNRPTALDPDALPPGWTTLDPVFFGGPVEPEIAIGLVESPGPHEGWERVGEAMWLADLDGVPVPVLRLRIFSGYAGWGPGQLEDEIARGDWVVAEATTDDVFTPAPEELWRAVLHRQPDPIRLLASYPADPTLN